MDKWQIDEVSRARHTEQSRSSEPNFMVGKLVKALIDYW
jgi:hypothetical protein